jgi:hypothetical protein
MLFGLVIEFIEHLGIVTTSDCSALANSHTLQFTRACAICSQLLCSPVYSAPLHAFTTNQMSSRSLDC